MCDLTVEDLKSLGLSLGEARLFKKEAEAAAAPQVSHPLASSLLHASQPHSAVAGGSAAASHSTLASIPLPSCALARSLATSHFKREYDTAECPDLQHQLFASIHAFISTMCQCIRVPAAAGKDLFLRLQGESFENPQELLSQVQVAATRIWTSTQKLQGAGVDKAFNVEFCSLLNRALRDDVADVMPHLVIIVRAINALCIVRPNEKSLKFPPNAVSHRGGALPRQYHAFFAVGCKYRVPMYLATSFSEDKAYAFWYAAFRPAFNVFTVA
jgi:hypothetical protein